MPRSDWEDDLDHAQTCLDTLEFCGTIDQVALQFHSNLVPFYKKLRDYKPSSAVTDSSSATIGDKSHPSTYLLTSPPQVDSAMADISRDLLNCLCRPFGNPTDTSISMFQPSVGSITNLGAITPVSEIEIATPPLLHPQPGRPYILASMEATESTWDIDDGIPVQWDAKELCLPDAAVTGSAVDGTNQPGRFLGSLEPSGWFACA
jgi:hypothetical protein